MSKYKEVFEARKQEADKSENKEIVKSGKPEIAKSGNKENNKSVNKEILKSLNPEIQKNGNNEDLSKLVNLGIKVAESRRRFWGGQAKMQGVTISEVIIEALSKRFGEPE